MNLLVTIILLLFCVLLAIVIENIGDALTVIGSLTNPSVGFILPGLFYLKLVPNLPKYKIWFAWFIMIATTGL